MTQDHLPGKFIGPLSRGLFLPLLERGARTLVSGDLGFSWAKGQLRVLWFPKSRPEAGPVTESIAQGLTLIKAPIRLQTLFLGEVTLVFAFVKSSHLSPVNILKAPQSS